VSSREQFLTGATAIKPNVERQEARTKNRKVRGEIQKPKGKRKIAKPKAEIDLVRGLGINL
jgi:hypothetical protein